MKKLYVTDLDGTLLNKNEGISQKSIDTINELISKGADITIATARSPVSASKYTSKINLQLPILCYNGEIIYDTVKKSIIRSFSFDDQTKENILRPIFREGYRPFIHTYDKNEESHVYHYDIKSDGEKWYYNARMNDPMDKRFRQEGACEFSYKDETVFHVCCIDTYDTLSRLKKLYDDIDGISIQLYKDVYVDDTWWLEFYNIHGNKGDGVNWLKQKYNPTEVICFGDNHNDLPMFKVADIAITLSTAAADIKSQADVIIGSPEDEAVPNYILKDYLSE